MAKKRYKKVEALKTRATADQIIAYLQNDVDELSEREQVKLTPKLRQRLERISQAKSWLFEHKQKQKVVDMLANEYSISEVTAYRDIQLMEQVYGPLLRMSKDMHRAIAIEMIKEDRALADEKNDAKAKAQCTKNYIILNQLDKEDVEQPDFSAFQPPDVIFAYLPEQVGLEAKDESEILKKVSDWYEQNSEVAEEVDDDED